MEYKFSPIDILIVALICLAVENLLADNIIMFIVDVIAILSNVIIRYTEMKKR